MKEEETREAIKDGSFCAVMGHAWLIVNDGRGTEKRSCRLCGKHETLIVNKKWVDTDAP